MLVLALVVVMVNLGFWQLRRLDERRTSNAQVKERTAEQPVPIESVAAPTTAGPDLAALRYRAVSATGTFDGSTSTVIAGRTQAGRPGSWVVTPMRVGGDTVLVLRGFAGLEPSGTPPAPPAPTGTVGVDGYALAISGFDNVAKHDLQALRDAMPGTLPVVVQATASHPADDPSLQPISLPSLDEGPHLSYAVQWFLFSAIALLGYPFALRRAAAKREV